MLLLVTAPHVHISVVPQAQPQHQGTKDDDITLVTLSSCKYHSGERKIIMIEAIFNDNLLQIRSTITEHKHLSVITNKIYFGCAIINAICQVSYVKLLNWIVDSQYCHF